MGERKKRPSPVHVSRGDIRPRLLARPHGPRVHLVLSRSHRHLRSLVHTTLSRPLVCTTIPVCRSNLVIRVKPSQFVTLVLPTSLTHLCITQYRAAVTLQQNERWIHLLCLLPTVVIVEPRSTLAATAVSASSTGVAPL